MRKINVIIPVHNDEKYIGQCIDSVRNQTLKDLCIICVDDGSVDQSRCVIRDKKKIDNRIILLTQENLGASAARNHGLRYADSEYVLFLDADDFYDDTTALEKMYYHAQMEGANICAAYMKYYRNNRFSNAEYFREFDVTEGNGRWIRFAEIQQDWGFTCYLYSLKMIRENKIEFPPYSVYEDPVFLLKCMAVAERFYLVPVSLYCYRQGHHARSYTAKSILDLVKGIFDNLRIAFEFKYQKLYDLLIKRLNENYRQRILDYITVDIVEELINVKKFDTKINRNNTIELLGDVNQLLMTARKDVLKKIDINESAVTKGLAEIFIFPFHIFNEGDRVVIYGSSELGVSLYQQAVCLKYVDIVGIVSDDNTNTTNLNNVPFYNVEKLRILPFDYVLLATKDKDKAKKMRNNAISIGVKDSCIVWDGGAYNIIDFYQKVYIPLLQKEVGRW